MPFVSSGIFKIKLFGSIGTCCDYLPVRLIHFPLFFLYVWGRKIHKNPRRKAGEWIEKEREKRSWNIKLLNWLHTKKRLTTAIHEWTNEIRKSAWNVPFLDENQYLIMQLSIRKLLSVCSPNGSHSARIGANKAVNWHSRLLLFDLWTENNHPFFRLQIP
jgi:hypothetical protein